MGRQRRRTGRAVAEVPVVAAIGRPGAGRDADPLKLIAWPTIGDDGDVKNDAVGSAPWPTVTLLVIRWTRPSCR